MTRGDEAPVAMSSEAARTLALQLLRGGKPAATVIRQLRSKGVAAVEAKALVADVRRVWRHGIVEQMISAFEEGLSAAEVAERFRNCGESSEWVDKAVKRANEEVEEVVVVESDPMAFRRMNLIGVGVLGIVGGLAATLISTSPDGGGTLYWGAILVGAVSLASGLAMGRKERSE